MAKLPEEELWDEYMSGEEIDPTEYDQFALEKFHEMRGEGEDDC